VCAPLQICCLRRPILFAVFSSVAFLYGGFGELVTCLNGLTGMDLLSLAAQGVGVQRQLLHALAASAWTPIRLPWSALSTA
jgi:hypothetical protein